MIMVDHITKQYMLGQIGSTTLRDELQRFGARIHHREDPTRRIGAADYSANETFLALDDVSFEVKAGERVGIIGRNGAGKSTLLKLIARVTAPTSGTIGLNGRVASMLEVGTGFHGELTGRENIYMNGAILGMRRREINERLEDIIEFSECRQFIDTPVKRYSSGMYVKLAFSVAAHLRSEIMIMDEVLAVGDIAFQKKCLDKMNEASRTDGRTVLYVSHNMNTIRNLCERCIVLDNGKVIFDGSVSEGIDVYLRSSYAYGEVKNDLSTRKRLKNMNIALKLMSAELYGKANQYYEFGEELLLRVTMKCAETVRDVCFRVEIMNSEGVPVGTALAENVVSVSSGQTASVTLRLKTDNIIPGYYYATLTIYQMDAYQATADLDSVREAFSFEIVDSGHRMPLVWKKAKWGSILLDEMCVINAETKDE